MKHAGQMPCWVILLSTALICGCTRKEHLHLSREILCQVRFLSLSEIALQSIRPYPSGFADLPGSDTAGMPPLLSGGLPDLKAPMPVQGARMAISLVRCLLGQLRLSRLNEKLPVLVF